MLKQLGMLASFLILSAVTLVGCSNNQSRDDCCPPVCERPCPAVCPEPCRPVCPPVCRPEPVCPPVCRPEPVCPPACPPVCPPVCRPVCPPVCAPVCPAEPVCCPPPMRPCHSSNAELNCLNYVTVRARNPNMCLLGDQYPLDFDVHACLDVCDVTVTTHLPEGVTFMKSEPPALVEGRKLTWQIGPMNKDECRAARVWLKCECEGPLCACFCATATPVQFCALLCAKPILVCEHCGTEQVCPGEPVNYTVTATNRGSCTAEDVVVTFNVAPELEHSSCLRTLTFKLGNLEPCQSKKVNICLTAVKRGKACSSAVISACNADSVSCNWCTCVCCCAVELDKVGPKEVPIGKNADYQIVAANTGDLPLTDVVITDVAPNATSIVAAPGAQINGNQAVWRIREMKPGDKANYNITLTTCTPGCFTNKVSLVNCQDCNACAEFTTRWRGRPALNVCVVESADAICIGEQTTYTITVINQGSEADSNVVVTVRFPNELAPVNAGGDSRGTVSGQTVTFAPANNVRPRQTLTYRVTAQAKASGDARVITEVSSDGIKTPIVQQESTIVN